MKSEKKKNQIRTGTDVGEASEPRRSAGVQRVSGTMIGRIAVSNAGRDRERYFVVVGEVDDLHVTVADGRLRRMDRPKKKKLKHLKLVSFAGMECVEKIADGSCSDSYLRRVISAYRNEPADGVEPQT